MTATQAPYSKNVRLALGYAARLAGPDEGAAIRGQAWSRLTDLLVTWIDGKRVFFLAAGGATADEEEAVQSWIDAVQATP